MINSHEASLYVQSARLNGKPLERAWFRHAEIQDGGLLELEMGDKPNDWGKDAPPPSMLEFSYW